MAGAALITAAPLTLLTLASWLRGPTTCLMTTPEPARRGVLARVLTFVQRTGSALPHPASLVGWCALLAGWLVLELAFGPAG
jgi:hypothetical protein